MTGLVQGGLIGFCLNYDCFDDPFVGFSHQHLTQESFGQFDDLLSKKLPLQIDLFIAFVGGKVGDLWGQ